KPGDCGSRAGGVGRSAAITVSAVTTRLNKTTMATPDSRECILRPSIADTDNLPVRVCIVAAFHEDSERSAYCPQHTAYRLWSLPSVSHWRLNRANVRRLPAKSLLSPRP